MRRIRRHSIRNDISLFGTKRVKDLTASSLCDVCICFSCFVPSVSTVHYVFTVFLPSQIRKSLIKDDVKMSENKTVLRLICSLNFGAEFGVKR